MDDSNLNFMTEIFNPLRHSVCLSSPVWTAETAWLEHVPFAMFAVSALRPQILVELGTWRGVSYCAFCQAVKETGQMTRCYAVDTWRGDEHAGNLGDEALFALRSHHEPLYADFSRLIQSNFDDALPYFADDSIDLLHIDGFHTYDAVKKDFETWLPKMSARGVVLFHDLNVRERDFGVWKLWDEVSTNRPHFAFLHGHGLGVLATGAEIPADLQFLFDADERETALIRQCFHALGARLEAVQQIQIRDKIILEHKEYIKNLRTYEQIVNDSAVLRGFRVLKDEGITGFVKKSLKKT